MAKVIAPLFSLDASGHLSKSIVYSKWKGLNTVRQYRPPTTARTAAQVTNRSYFSKSLDFFREFLTDSDIRTSWNLSASLTARPVNGWNIFISRALNASKDDAASSFVSSIEALATGQIDAIMLNLDDGATGDETGNFDIYYGRQAASMTLVESVQILSGHIVSTELGGEHEYAYVQIKKNGIDRSGVFLAHFDTEPVYNYLIAADSSGNERDGYCSTVDILTLVDDDWEGMFDGANDYINFPDFADTNSVQKLTMVGWFYFTPLTNSDVLLAQWDQLAEKKFSWQTGGTKERLYFYANGGSGQWYTGSVLTSNEWLHLSVVIDGAEASAADKCRFYKNGILQTNIKSSSFSAFTSTTVDLKIGDLANYPDRNLHGKVDDVYVYANVALSASEILDLSQGTPPADTPSIHITMIPKEV